MAGASTGGWRAEDTQLAQGNQDGHLQALSSHCLENQQLMKKKFHFPMARTPTSKNLQPAQPSLVLVKVATQNGGGMGRSLKVNCRKNPKRTTGHLSISVFSDGISRCTVR